MTLTFIATVATASDPSWRFTEAFDSNVFADNFAHARLDRLNIVTAPERAPSARVLRVQVPKGGNTGANFSYMFQERLGYEPEELYARYYVRFAEDWVSGEGGKLPGPSGTYDRAGWGGRPVHGDDGWSARMGFHDSWWEGEVMLSYYTYHMDARTSYGDRLNWDRRETPIWGHAIGSLRPGTWYCVESHIRLNRPGRRDGLLEGWVDGRLALRYKGLRFRDTEALKIEKYWFNVYHGGVNPAPRTLTVHFDDLVLSGVPVGCHGEPAQENTTR